MPNRVNFTTLVFPTLQKGCLVLTCLVLTLIAFCTHVFAQSETDADSTTDSADKVSLIKIAPSLYYSAARSWRFYGDENTHGGDLFERSNILGDFGGSRDTLVDNGVYIDLRVTQFAQNVADGGRDDSNSTRTNGSSDLTLWVDSGQANLWSGGALFAHFEVNWGTDIDADSGALLPANFDAVMPSADSPDVALSELYYMQALSPQWVLGIGKQNFASWADTNLFANNERNQFGNLALVSNPLAGVFFPYTTLGAWLDWAPSDKHNLVFVWAKKEGVADSSGLSDLDDGDNSYAIQYVYTADIGGKPGHYLLAGAYTNQDTTGFKLTGQELYKDPFREIIGLVPTDEDDNYAVIGNFDQYLWVKDTAPGNRPVTRPEGVGFFARAGWAPDDRNVIDQFYSFGLGGYGTLIPGRHDDNWGIGWAGSHISDDLRKLSIAEPLREWEHAFEIFYNFALSPAVQLSLDAQSIRTASRSADDNALILGARLQLEF